MALELNGTTGVQGNSGAFVAGTAVASTSGTSIDFTSIPSWVKRVSVSCSNISTNGTSPVIVQIGGSSIETSAYDSSASYVGPANGSTPTAAGFMLNASGQNLENFWGTIVLSLVNSSTNTWVSSVSGTINQNGTWYGILGGGSKSITGSLQRVRITTVSGTLTFDAGTINILYE